MINVRCPNLKWECGNFKSETDHHEQDAEEKSGLSDEFGTAHEQASDFTKISESRCPENKRDAEYEKRG